MTSNESEIQIHLTIRYSTRLNDTPNIIVNSEEKSNKISSEFDYLLKRYKINQFTLYQKAKGHPIMIYPLL